MSTNGKEYKLAIRIAGIIDKSFTTSLAAANTSLKATLLSLDKDFTMLDKGFNNVMKLGTKCFSAIASATGVATLAIGAATAASIAVGSEFESAFAGVKKTVTATDKEFEKFRQDILDMSRVIPSSASDIAGVMEIAGQLGIANEYLTDFTETMINLGVSTNMTAEDAATALARFANITDMDPNDYERLGSVIVALGNNFATTEEEIVAMATRLASTGDLVGLTEAQIMALSTAMSSAGIKEQAGGSTMSKLLRKMQLAVETGSGALAEYASVANMTGQEFADAFKKDAVVALSAFIDGLKDTERNGKSAIAILNDMGLKEDRLSNTILALTGSEKNMSDAIKTANEAWEENTALATEAGERYKTVESQLQLTQNAFKELGIVAYEDSREPFVNVLGDITDAIHDATEYVDGPNGMGAWVENISTELPTLQRKFKKYGEPVFEGITGAGKWIVKNGKGIISVLSGVGATMAGYKVASTGVHFITALTKLGSMNPITWGILGTVGAIGALTTAVVAYKQHEAELVDNNLAEHFGNIALSMEDIQQVAEYIVSTESLAGVKDTLEAFEGVDLVADELDEITRQLNKMNWKVMIGMELSEDEQGEYKTAINEYIQTAQNYVTKSQYAVSIGLKIGFGDSAEGANLASKVGVFYQDTYNEMILLGEQLSEAVNEAFADNILDPEEVGTISEIQSKMAELQRSMATSEFDAQLSLLGNKYGGNLDSESFQNLMVAINEQTETSTKAFDEAYIKNRAAIESANAAGEYLTPEDYQAAIDLLDKQYLTDVSELQTKGVDFMLQTIMQRYGDELNPLISEYMSGIEGAVNSAGELDWENGFGGSYASMFSAFSEMLKSGELDSETGDAVQKLLDAMAPSMEQMEKLREKNNIRGIDLSESMQEVFYNYNLLSALMEYGEAGEGFNYLFGQGLKESGVWNDFSEQFIANQANQGAFGELFGIIGQGALDGASAVSAENINEAADAVVKPAVEGIYAWSKETIQEYFSQGFQVSANVDISLNPSLKGFPNLLTVPVDHKANGGLVTKPELTWFAENGPEMAIPIDGSRNAVSLWEQTGRLLGMDSVLDRMDLSGGVGPKIEYSPTLQFYGEAPSRDDIVDALRMSQDEFDSLMERYIKTHGRVAFG